MSTLLHGHDDKENIKQTHAPLGLLGQNGVTFCIDFYVKNIYFVTEILDFLRNNIVNRFIEEKL